MATPGQLVETMAEVLGVPLETVTNYDRVLSENGLRSKSGRGRGAAKVTAGDATNLLIAIMGSPIAGAAVKEAANTCRTYASMRVLESRGEVGTHNFAKVGLKTVDELPKKHTLHDAISALVNSAAKGEYYRKPEQDPPIDRFRIRLFGPHNPRAQIVATTGGFDKRGRFALRTYSPLHWDVNMAKKDLYQERIITYRTIRALGSLLSDGDK